MQTLKVGMTGHDAKAANYSLLGHNIFGHSELHDEQHGVFTDKSAAATKKMKWWLGYPEPQINLTYDVLLHKYLSGMRKRTPAMKVRGWKRRGGRPVPREKFVFPIKNARWTKLGWPYQGTHGVQFNRDRGTDNWESERAVDIGVSVGNTVVAPADGEIGTAFGPLSASEPRMAGIRLHLMTADDEIYIAHLASTRVGLGPHSKVKQGEIIGQSGSANGVPHIHVAHKYGDPGKIYF